MKKVMMVLLATIVLSACGEEQKSDNEKAGTTEAVIDKAQEGMNDVIDTLQSKGDKLADTLKKKVVEPVKADVKNAGERIKDAVKEMKEKAEQ